MKKNKRYWWALILIIPFWVLGLFISLNKITYKEFVNCSNNSKSYVIIESPNQTIRQSFKPSFDITSGFSIKIGTFARDNNSDWNIILLEKKTSKIINKWSFNASKLVDNDYYEVKLKHPKKLDKSKTYELIIYSTNCNENNSLAFYCDNDFINNNMNFAFKIYGGNVDLFWITIYALYSIAILSILFRIRYLEKNNNSLSCDLLFHSMIIGALYFILMYIFSMPGTPTFIDETDNMMGGILIAKGEVIYRDYITQHTPFSYYLCGFYALLGANSVQQFRLLFYITCSLVWGLLYFRHAKSIGKTKMTILPILQIFFLVLVEPQHNGQILSDNIQGLCMIALLLEFVEYRKDYKLDWKRIVIISSSVFISFCSAFISIFAISAVFLFFVISEFNFFNKNKHSLIYFLKRYGKFSFLSLLPFASTLIYFYVNGALEKFYEMAYLFNRQIYPKYDHYGENIVKNIFYGFTCFSGLIINSINSMLSGSANIEAIIKTLNLLIVSIIIFKLIKKKEYINGLFLFVFLCTTGTRGNESFHSLTYWNIVLLILTLYYDELNINGNTIKKYCIIATVLSICFVNRYISTVYNYAFTEQRTISDWEDLVVKNTHNGEGIFIETACFDPLYLLFKNRLPINRLTYFLPWYMDWYEQITIDDLKNKSPEILVYRPDIEVSNIKNYYNTLNIEIQKSYTKVDENLFVYKKNSK